ncbi:multicopper oxidase family protein [Methylococcus sp. Mc7]|uniref:multicopper oxidase family protein n=1 Tax=Methylococcus sp. Mc7 TaxID=2860258 RepID=UPI001C52D51A|nr:multicopper oxidase domain-containing protein [Methylococcus sp. Mc7]QXP83905.1 multicopper oxidase domain-containing protein [Methylococcus sp. Mc7]
MQSFINRSRRRFLSQAGIGLLAYAGLPAWLRAMEGMMTMPKGAPNKASPNFNPDAEIELICLPGSVSILPGQTTRVEQYVGRLIKRPENSLMTLPGSYLGPLMRFQTGQKVRIHLRNELDEPTITHWHGLIVPALMDGHPMYALDKGQTFVYEFEMQNRASMILYHPHTHGITGKQVYHGLAGAILVNDEEEKRLGLPSGEYEIPIVIQDRMFDEQNQLIYARHMHDRMIGFHGDRILVNGKLDASFDVASRAYRLRILNGSNARIYKLAWDDNSPMVVIGVDGGLLETPVHKPYVMLGPGERIDVWADFTGRSVGTQLVMRSRPFTGVLPKMAERMMRGEMGGMGMMGGMRHEGESSKSQEGGHAMGGMGMMGGMHGGGGMGMGMMSNKLPLGSDYPVFTVRVTRQVSDSPSLPTQLCKVPRYQVEDTANPDKPAPLGISEAPMAMLLNGRPYAPNDFLPNERFPFNTLQLIEIFHAHGGEGGHGGGSTGGEPGGHGGEAKPQEGGGMQHGMGGGMGMGMMGGMRHGGEDKPQAQEGGHAMGGMGGMGGGMGMMGGMGGMGMMMSMAHPIHLHEEPFQIISRTIGAEEAADYATVRDGFIDSGLKDTVLVMPGEKVRIIKPFKYHKGVFMVHCHNLEHEDMGMMREYLIE